MASNVLQFPRIPANDDDHSPPPAGPMVLSIKLRGKIEATVEYLLAILDASEKDCDLEPEDDACEAGDDGCGFVQLGYRSGWGCDRDEHEICPEYGINQDRLAA